MLESMRPFVLIAATVSLGLLAGCSNNDSAPGSEANSTTAAPVTVTTTMKSSPVPTTVPPRATATTSAAATSPAASTSPAATSPTATNAAGTSGAPQPSQTQAQTDSQAFRDSIYSQMMSNVQPGDPIRIGSEEATICVYGDGYGLGLVAANKNTSCDFARAVMATQVDGLNPTDDNVRTTLKPQVRATSPVTGQTYTMNCSNDSNNLIVCTGGDNAKVYMY